MPGGCSGRGSSPLARGTQVRWSSKSGAVGLIPARAGNTLGNSVVFNARRAHPRSRGEHLERRLNNPQGMGSSPLARGTRQEVGILESWKGLIPARAGNTQEHQTHPRRVGAHPRSRGEHSVLLTRANKALGSSPLARGTRRPKMHHHRISGLIPARAGNTLVNVRVMSCGRAHPRSRGEHTC